MGVLRIVKMEFEEELVREFDALFGQIHSDIEAMPGCRTRHDDEIVWFS